LPAGTERGRRKRNADPGRTRIGVQKSMLYFRSADSVGVVKRKK
jgi:hypothetical protein